MRPTWLPYVLPMAVYLGLTAIEGGFEQHYVWIYFIKIALTILVLWFCRETWKDIRFELKYVVPCVVVGFALCAVWVWVELQFKYPHIPMGARTAYDPISSLGEPMRWAFIAVRMLGLVLVVPVMEELFWRSFLLRYATKPDFASLSIGSFSWGAFIFVAALFGAAHPEWLPAVVFAVATGLLVKYTKSIFACFVTHAATNLALGIYVLKQGAWQFW